jgi:N-dimethylarginine dimethylaminohydrolase
MHSPGKELDLITPRSYANYLFGDAIDPTQFRVDHTRFIDALRSERVKVFLITELLHDRPVLLKETETLPNLIYTRDTATVTRNGYILSRMKTPVRRRESRIVEAALRKLSVSPLLEAKPPATIEGGDMIFLDEETLLLGIGKRTNLAAIQQLRRIGERSGLRNLLAIPLPSWALHLDGTMMPVDSDLAIVHLRSLQKAAILFEDARLRKNVNLPQFLRKREINLVEVTDYERQRRATNVIPLGARKAIAYNGNSRVRRELVKNGVDLIEIEASELIRGSGGPRCMTATTSRE